MKVTHQWCLVQIIGEQAVYKEGDDFGESVTHERVGATLAGAIAYLKQLGYTSIRGEFIDDVAQIRASKRV